MPQIFKALTSIAVWVLFIHGIISIAGGGYIMWIKESGDLTFIAAAACGIGTANMLMAAAAAKLRGLME
jgi:hypothetical protein